LADSTTSRVSFTLDSSLDSVNKIELTAEQVATLDAASDFTPTYPYWHQRGFKERIPPPVPGKE